MLQKTQGIYNYGISNDSLYVSSLLDMRYTDLQNSQNSGKPQLLAISMPEITGFHDTDLYHFHSTPASVKMFLWLPQVGFERYTLVPFKNLAMKSAPTRNEPVPDRDWTHAIRFCMQNNDC